MFRHIIMMKRLSYHYHIVTREEDEMIKKVYMKQKEMQLKGDWIQTIKNDYAFLGEDLEQIETYIKSTSKDIFIQNMKKKVYKSAFLSLLDTKEVCKKKMAKLEYEEL